MNAESTNQQSNIELPEADNPLNLVQSPIEPGHLNSEDMPWVEQAPGIEMKVLRISDDMGTWVVMNRLAPGTTLPTHRHSGCVTAYTVSGKWRYLEHDFIASSGSIVREPANSAHTLNVPDSGTEPAIVFFVIEGGLVHIGPDGSIWGISDAQTEKARYYELAKEQNKTIPKHGVLS